jgi:XTP/dITP diphosphohydrolase
MIVKLVCASRNKGKIGEFRRLFEGSDFAGLTIETLSLDDVKYNDETEETGETFLENAFIKASTVCRFSGLPAFADDSGLCVDFLNGAPGVSSARFGGPRLDDAGRRELLLSKLENVPDEKRTARFVCALYLCLPDGRKIEIQESCEGKISREDRGRSGFGYDSVFVYDNRKSFGEMNSSEKDLVSHRGKAVRAFAEKVKKYLGGI